MCVGVGVNRYAPGTHPGCGWQRGLETKARKFPQEKIGAHRKTKTVSGILIGQRGVRAGGTPTSPCPVP